MKNPLEIKNKFPYIANVFSAFLIIILMLGLSTNILAQNFEGTFTLNMESTHDGHSHDHDKSTITYSYYKNKIAIVSGTDGTPSNRMILDHEAKVMTSLSEQGGRKAGIKMKMTDDMYKAAKDSYDKSAEEGDKDFDGSWERTGNTKTIQNLRAEEIKVKSSDGSGYMWITNDLGLNFASLMGMMGGGPGGGGGKAKNDKFSDVYSVGFPLEALFKSGNETSKIWVTDISDEPNMKLFNTDGYEIQDMSNFDMSKFQNMQQQQGR